MCPGGHRSVAYFYFAIIRNRKGPLQKINRSAEHSFKSQYLTYQDVCSLGKSGSPVRRTQLSTLEVTQ